MYTSVLSVIYQSYSVLILSIHISYCLQALHRNGMTPNDRPYAADPNRENKLITSLKLYHLTYINTNCLLLSEVRAQFPCWKENGQELSQACRSQTVQLKESMHQFAKNKSQHNIKNICRFEHYLSLKKKATLNIRK
uniref:Secreted protein n=1 Tax=Heterorhabditis bacteriophora TaxID=37862 RepID=A0A1I7XEG5_HETBA